MQQVLEATKIQSKEPKSIIDGGYYPASRFQKRNARPTGAAKKTRWPSALLRFIMSCFKYSESQYIPACSHTQAQYDSALAHISRIDPYLYIKSLAG
jgi:hypothetical protein